jgi:hypothetical protein
MLGSLRVIKRAAAGGANVCGCGLGLYSYADVVSAAKGLYGVLRYRERAGDSGVAFAAMPRRHSIRCFCIEVIGCYLLPITDEMA